MESDQNVLFLPPVPNNCAYDIDEYKAVSHRRSNDSKKVLTPQSRSYHRNVMKLSPDLSYYGDEEKEYIDRYGQEHEYYFVNKLDETIKDLVHLSDEESKIMNVNVW